MRRLGRLVVIVVVFAGFAFWMCWLPTIYASGEDTKLVQTMLHPSSANDEPPLLEFFASPAFAAIIWPIAFVLLEITLSALASSSPVRAEGSRKYRIWYEDSGGGRMETSPVDINWLKREFGNYEVQDIDLLTPGTVESFAFGIDLCVGALATDLSILFALPKIGSLDNLRTLMAAIASLFIVHLITVSLAILLLRSWSNDERKWARVIATLVADFVGVGAIISIFASLSSLVTG